MPHLAFDDIIIQKYLLWTFRNDLKFVEKDRKCCGPGHYSEYFALNSHKISLTTSHWSAQIVYVCRFRWFVSVFCIGLHAENGEKQQKLTSSEWLWVALIIPSPIWFASASFCEWAGQQSGSAIASDRKQQCWNVWLFCPHDVHILLQRFITIMEFQFQKRFKLR